jgi:hypothetical protein
LQLRSPVAVVPIINNDIMSSNQQDEEYITRPWLTEAPQGMPVPQIIQACAEQDASCNNESNLFYFNRRAMRINFMCWKIDKRGRTETYRKVP